MTRMLTIVTYDIADDRRRRKIAAFLEDRMVRVQESVFEAQLTKRATQRLHQSLAGKITDEDSIRIYAIAAAGLQRCSQMGGAPFMSNDSHWIM